MPNVIKEVTVSSKRTTPVGKEFYSFSCSLTEDCSGLTEREKNKHISSLWKRANDEVDLQVKEVKTSYDTALAEYKAKYKRDN